MASTGGFGAASGASVGVGAGAGAAGAGAAVGVGAGAGAGAGAIPVAVAPAPAFEIGVGDSGPSGGVAGNPDAKARAARESHRRSQFKKGLGDVGERHRRQFIAIRKQARREALMAKRRRCAPELGAGGLNSTPQAALTAAQLAGHVAEMAVDATRASGAKALRRALMADEPPIQEVIDAGAMAPLVDCLMRGTDEVKLEACWCLSNIATGTHDQTQLVLRAAPHLIALLRVETPVVAEQAAWTLGNVAGDSQMCRDTLLANGVVGPAISLLRSKDRVVVCTAAWMISNLLRGSTPCRPFMEAGLLPLFEKWMKMATPDVKILAEVAWGLSFLTAREDEPVEQLARMGLVPHLVNMMAPQHPKLAFPAVRVAGNMCGCDARFAEAFLACPAFLTNLANLLISRTLRAQPKEVLSVLANVAAGPQSHRDAIAGAGFIPPVCSIFVDSPYDVQAQAVYLLANMSVCEESDALLKAIAAQPNVTNTFLRLCDVEDADVVRHCLGFFERLLSRVEGAVEGFEAAGGLEVLDDIRYRGRNEHLGIIAGAIADKYFDDEDEETLAAATSDTLPFGVGVGAGGPGPAAAGRGRGRGAHMTRPAWMPAPPPAAVPAAAQPMATAGNVHAPGTGAAQATAAAAPRQATLADFGFGPPPTS